MERMWINQPSTHQAYHKYHGTNVLVEKKKDSSFVWVYFLSGAVQSTWMSKNALSPGWKDVPIMQKQAPKKSKAEKIKDDLLAALIEARDALNGAPNTEGLHTQINSAISAALLFQRGSQWLS